MQTQSPFSLGHLSNDALLAGISTITRAHQALTAELIAHLAEMDTRKLYLSEATPSLFAYCVERLGFSEDEACRRIEAARMARKFPSIYPKLEHGEVSLSVLGKLKPFLTEANALELFDAVSGKSVREAERVLAARFPRPEVADSIRKLPDAKIGQPAGGIQPAQVTRTEHVVPPAGAPLISPRAPDRGRFDPMSADRVQVKFTASRALEEKLTLARDLMSHSNPKGDLATVIEAALDLLIAERLKQKFGRTKRAQKPRPAKRSRVTNATRREVVDRDGLECSFVDPSGRRCSARAFLELDHREGKARGGGSEAENIRVLCRAHNQGEAERVFGKDHMERCRKKRDLPVRDGATAKYVRGFSKRSVTSRVSEIASTSARPASALFP